ncbi:MAG: hypothetical protein AAFQ53_00440 [Bacteroidota bacterium]
MTQLVPILRLWYGGKGQRRREMPVYHDCGHVEAVEGRVLALHIQQEVGGTSEVELLAVRTTPERRVNLYLELLGVADVQIVGAMISTAARPGGGVVTITESRRQMGSVPSPSTDRPRVSIG